MSDNIVEEWLRSLNLIHYTQAFLDNGYDDLEICKQIGQPDLDAIGVQKPSHRKEILDAVRSLRELGGTSVYFTLEEVRDAVEPVVHDDDDDDSDRIYTFSAGSRAKKKLDEYEEGKKALVTFPRVQLIGMIRDKLRAEEIDIGVLPYTNPDGSRGDMDILAHRYAEEFKTHFHDVLEQLEYLRRKKLGLEPEDSPPLCGIDGSPAHRRISQNYANPDDMSLYYSENIYGDNGMCCISKVQRTRRSSSRTYREQEDAEKKKGVSTLARLFGKKPKQQKRPNYVYRQFEGDPHASQITMTNDQIMEIMLLVKDGKLTQAQALDQVKTHGVKRQESTENGDHSQKELELKAPGSWFFKSKDSPKRRPKQPAEARLQEPTDYEEPPTPDNDTTRLLDSRLQPAGPNREEVKFRRSQSTEEKSPPFHVFRKSSTDSNVSAPVLGCLPNKYNTQTSGHSWARDTSAPNISDSIACGGSPRLRKEHSDLGPAYPAGIYKPSQLEEDIEENQNNEDLEEEDLDDPMNMNGKRRSVIERIRKLSYPRRLSEGQCSTDDEIPSDKEKHISSASSVSTNSDKSVSKGKKGIGNFIRKKKPARTHEIQLNSDGSERYRTDSQKSSDDSLALRGSAESMGSTSQVSSCSLVSGGSSTEEDSVLYAGAILAKAVVMTNCTPSPYERGALTLEKGDIVHVTDMDQSGTWKGIHKNKYGTFKYIHVELLKEEEPAPPKARISTIRRIRRHKPRPRTLEELLKRIGLERLQCMLFLNGYASLEDFSQIDEETLNDLQINDPETRGKILTAAELLLDYDSQDSMDHSSGTKSDSKATPTGLSPSHSPAMIPSPELSPRTGSDSGCVDTEGLDESRETDSNSDTLKVSNESSDVLETNVTDQDNGGETPVIESCDIQPVAEITFRNSQSGSDSGDGVVMREKQRDPDTQCQGQNQKLHVKQIVQSIQQRQSEMCGFCGIPAPLVQRYAEELRSNLNEVAQNMENIRVKDAKAAGITTVPNDNLAETALNPVHDANTESLSDLMTSIGLPMYTDLLLQHGCKAVDVFRNMRDTDFKACGVTDSSHIRKLVSVADLLRFRYEAKLQTGKVAKVSMIKDKV